MDRQYNGQKTGQTIMYENKSLSNTKSTENRDEFECSGGAIGSNPVTRSTAIFKDPNVVKHLSLLHDKYVIAAADKAPNNIDFVCKSRYIDCLMKELGTLY